MAVMGRAVLGYGEISRMHYVAMIPNLYRARESSKNWAEWAKDNRDQARILNEAERLYNVE